MIWVVTGEASGDQLAALWLEKLKKILPSLEIEGVLGPKVRALGGQAFLPMERFQIMGFKSALFSLPKILFDLDQVTSEILRKNPKLLLLVDYPGFNLLLAKKLRSRGFKGFIIQAVAPTVWAYKKGRIKTVRENVNLLATLYPFEAAYFPKNDHFEALFVGHPLAKKAKIKSKSSSRHLAIFPGSRQSVVKRQLPILWAAAKKVMGNNPISISVASEKMLSMVQKITENRAHYVMASELEKLFESCSCALATSGTITLELALAQIPTLITYSTSPFDYKVASLLGAKLPHYGIVNILFKRRICPELFGPNCTEKAIEEELSLLLKEPSPKLYPGLAESLSCDKGEKELLSRMVAALGHPVLHSPSMTFKIDIKNLGEGLPKKVAASLSPEFLADAQDALTQYHDLFEVEVEYALNEFFLSLSFEVKGFFNAPCTFCLENKKFPLSIKTSLEIPTEELPTKGDFDLMPLCREIILLDTPTFAECSSGACPERASCAQYLVKNEQDLLCEKEEIASQPLPVSGEIYGRTS